MAVQIELEEAVFEFKFEFEFELEACEDVAVCWTPVKRRKTLPKVLCNKVGNNLDQDREEADDLVSASSCFCLA